MCDEYNGWENKPTWMVHLWLSNDEVAWHAACATAKYGDEGAFRAFVEGYLNETATSGLKVDLLNWVLAQVNWGELLEAFKE